MAGNIEDAPHLSDICAGNKRYPEAVQAQHTLKMDDMDVMAAMGITGFGKQQKKRTLDPHRFDKQKRADSREVWLDIFLTA